MSLELISLNIKTLNLEKEYFSKMYNPLNESPLFFSTHTLMSNKLSKVAEETYPIVFLDSYKKELKSSMVDTRISYYKQQDFL